MMEEDEYLMHGAKIANKVPKCCRRRLKPTAIELQSRLKPAKQSSIHHRSRFLTGFRGLHSPGFYASE
jgi:hypothetical protein